MKFTTTSAESSRGGRTALAGVAAIGSVLAASSCCLPILPFVFAASLAGSSSVLNALRPYLLGASVLFMSYGFYQVWQSKQCGRMPSILSSALLWVSAAFVVVSIFFPQVPANTAASLLAR